jgi:hydroxymethylglutaryl-CoA reductase
MSGFYERSVRDRVEVLARTCELDVETRGFFERGGGLDVASADRMSENVVGAHGLPFSVALNFRVNDRDHVVPMAVEEPSVVAAASNAARMVRAFGGFTGEADPAVMTAQVQLDGVPDAHGARARLFEQRERLLAIGDESIPRLVARGGGCRDLEVRVLDADEGVLVCDLFVDVGDAMGANVVDTVAEAVAPEILEIAGGQMGLRILSNLPMRRLVRVRAGVDAAAVGGQAVLEGIARGSRFAELDPLRAVTHNKGFMNGLDAVAVALGQDWRSVEAAAHAFAAVSGKYMPISRWRLGGPGLIGEAELPLAVGTVGGSTRANAAVRAAFALIGVEGARELAVVMACAGLASNLAALRALAGEGIQKGHMRLHRRKLGQEGEASPPPPVVSEPAPLGEVPS